MPLTAYSISEQKEVDLEQVLKIMSRRHGDQDFLDPSNIPEEWRIFLRKDLECPCCFVTGAEVVRESRSGKSKKAIRQGYFRFIKPGHMPECDYTENGSESFVPDNLVSFGSTKSNLTRVVREIVCKGIQLDLFNQKTIRDMREWFFRRKTTSSLFVDLDPRLPGWLKDLSRATVSVRHLPQIEVPLSDDIISIPGFDWKAEATRAFARRHKATLDIMQENRLWRVHELSVRVESLAKRYHQENVFDPTVLQEEYAQSIALANFVSENYGPLSSASRSRRLNDDVAVCVLALSALLLFKSSWDIARAMELFARIANSPVQADPILGNVMGLNPFHDFEAWRMLKNLQESSLTVPNELPPLDERKKIEEELRKQFNV